MLKYGRRLCLGLMDAYAIYESYQNIQISNMVPILTKGLGNKRLRNPHRARHRGIFEFCGHHSDHCVGLLGKSERLADDSGIAAEPPLPKVVADDRVKLLFCHILTSCECATHACRDCEKLKVVGSHLGGGDALRLALSGHYEIFVGSGRYFLEELTLFTQCGEFRRGNGVPIRALFGICQCDCNYVLRVLDRGIAQQDAAYHTENCSIQAYSQTECNDHGKTEGRVFPQYAQSIANIHKKVFNGWPPPDCAAVLLNQSYIPKFPSSGGGSFFSGHAARNELLDLLFDVFPNLFREFAVKAA